MILRMPDLILDDFKSDLNRLKKLLSFMDMVRSFTAFQVPDVAGDDFTERTRALHALSKDCHGDFLILSGAMVLYLGGHSSISFVNDLRRHVTTSLANASDFRTCRSRCKKTLSS